MHCSDFSQLALIEPLLHALRDKGYLEPTPIQTRAIPPMLAGRDLLGVAQTGTGKTAAFALPILQRLTKESTATTRAPRKGRLPRALVLTPTRELAAQIGQSFADYGKHLGLRHGVIYGGVGQTPQVESLQRGLDVLIATPGRLLDLLSQGHLRLNDIEVFVLDEADRMLDMGFIHDAKRVIAALPGGHQTVLFSATMPDEIARLAGKILKEPVRVEVTPPASTVDKIEQRVLFVERGHKTALLAEILKDPAIERTLVFSRTKHGANRVAQQLGRFSIGAEAIHGNKSQGARERALANFRAGRTRVLVATDIAARGIDVPGITHVINYDLPNVPESYVHRIGRTARAGRDGYAISFCDVEERAYLKDIERLIRQKVPVVEDHPFHGRAPSQARDRAPDQGPNRASDRASDRAAEVRQGQRPALGSARRQRPAQGAAQGQRSAKGPGRASLEGRASDDREVLPAQANGRRRGRRPRRTPDPVRDRAEHPRSGQGHVRAPG